MRAYAVALCVVFSLAAAGCYSGDAPVGDECREKEQCSTGLCFQAERYGVSTGWPGGYCTEECKTTCDRGAACVEFEDSSFCMSACGRQKDCRDGYVCNLLEGACLPDCRLGFDCGSSLYCSEVGICAELSQGGDTDTGTDPAGLDPIGGPGPGGRW